MKQKQLSPEAYLKTRARLLPIEACYVNDNWRETGMASVIVARKHTNGNYTVGVYLVDIFALGTKDSFFRFNVEPEVLHELIDHAYAIQPEEVDYALAHNIIYGANAFAEENDFKVCKDFNLTQFILEEDTEDIPLIEIEFGKNGKPLLIM
jgi:hypothetical protein